MSFGLPLLSPDSGSPLPQGFQVREATNFDSPAESRPGTSLCRFGPGMVGAPTRNGYPPLVVQIDRISSAPCSRNALFHNTKDVDERIRGLSVGWRRHADSPFTARKTGAELCLPMINGLLELHTPHSSIGPDFRPDCTPNPSIIALPPLPRTTVVIDRLHGHHARAGER